MEFKKLDKLPEPGWYWAKLRNSNTHSICRVTENSSEKELTFNASELVYYGEDVGWFLFGDKIAEPQ